MNKYITPAEGAAIAFTWFQLKVPITLEQLKTAYRKQALILHPDKGGATAEFQAMQEAYHKLTSCMAVFDEPQVERDRLHTEEGDLLSDLGQGIGINFNARPCERCDQKGFTVTFEQVKRSCQVCDENGISYTAKQCPDCKGIGKVRTRKSKQVVQCRVCLGKGKVKVRRAYRADFQTVGRLKNEGFACPECHGFKTALFDDDAKPIYSTCRDCRGAGAIRIFNPVIPKGRLT